MKIQKLESAVKRYEVRERDKMVKTQNNVIDECYEYELKAQGRN